MRSKEDTKACKERLIRYACEHLNLTQRQWALRAGLSEAFIKTFSGHNMRRDTMAKIQSTYPDLNINWLLTGEGAMLLPGKESVVITNNKIVVGNNSGNKAGRDINISADDSSLKEQIASLKAEIEAKEKQLQEQRELINILIEKLSDGYRE